MWQEEEKEEKELIQMEDGNWVHEKRDKNILTDEHHKADFSNEDGLCGKEKIIKE